MNKEPNLFFSTREECEEVNEIQCKQINVTKYNLEIVTRCETQIDKSCNVTYIDVPTQECKPRRRNRWVQGAGVTRQG